MAGVTPLFERSNVFTISAQHNESRVYNKAFRLTTSTESNMVYSNGGYQCTVRPNENLIFTSPNLITKNSYSNYCKYLIYLNGDKSILAKSEYTLQEGEYICFFYKPDGAEYYHYVKYSEGTIIVPSITIRKQDDPTMPKGMPPIPWTAFRDLDDSTSGSLGAVASGITDNTEYSTLDKYIDDLCEDRFVLSTTSIEIKDVNSVTITDSTRYMCWILNTTTTNSNGESVCRLFSTGASLPAKYILQSGEYILYSNDSRTQLHLLGSGTQITVEGSGSTLDYNMDCPIVDYNNLISFGIDYLKDVWQEIPKGYRVTATEMQFIQLGEGNKISMTFEGESEISEGTTLTMKGDGVYADGEKLDLTNVSIAYSNGDSYSYLSNKNSDELAWNIRYVLNINSSPMTPQKLVTGQSISGMQPDKTPINLVGDDVSPLYIESNRSVSILGGENVDVSVIDLSSGGASPLQLYAYKMAPQSSGKTSDEQTTAWVVEYSAGLVCLSKVAGNGESSTMTHSFGIPKGCYVFELTTESSDTTASFTVAATGATLTCISTTSTTFKSPGKYYFTLKVTGEKPSISIITTNLMSCWVGELVPIEEAQSYLSNILNKDETLQGLVCSTMATLDVNGVFNYSHIVNDSSVIKQPLSAESFLLSSHIYNPFTICEWDITNPNDTIKVITKIRG